MRSARRVGTAVLLSLPFLLGAAAAPPAPDGRPLCRVDDDRIVEASGLVATGSPPGGVLVTANDSGDEGRLFVLDAGTCETVGVTRWADDPEDVEALAPGPATDGTATVWVGDIGDNPSNRDTVRVALTPVAPGERDVSPQWTELRYADGPHDAETLLRHPRTGRLFVVSKRVLGGAVYAVPDRVAPGGVGEMRRVGGVLPLATDGAFWPDGRHVILRNYGRAAIYSWPGLDRVADVALPAQPQGEALAVTPDGRVLVTSEGEGEPVLEVSLPPEARGALEGGASAGPGAGASGRPGGGQSRTPVVPGEEAGPSTSDEEQGAVVWRGVLVAAAGLVALVLVAGFFVRRPGSPGRQRRRHA